MFKKTIDLGKHFPSIGDDLKSEIIKYGEYRDVPKNSYLVKQGGTLNFLPIILDGLIKIYTEEEEIEFLMYYIKPNQCCIHNFNHLFDQNAVSFSAKTEKNTKVLCIPIAKVEEWFTKYPSFTQIILKDLQRNYEDLLSTTKQFVCYKIKDRLVNYLTKKAELQNCNMIAMSHKEIAYDLGTSREVVSRITKKLQASNLLIQHKRHIELRNAIL